MKKVDKRKIHIESYLDGKKINERDEIYSVYQDVNGEFIRIDSDRKYYLDNNVVKIESKTILPVDFRKIFNLK